MHGQVRATARLGYERPACACLHAENAKRAQAVLGRGASEVVLRRMGEVVAAVADARHRPPPAAEEEQGEHGDQGGEQQEGQGNAKGGAEGGEGGKEEGKNGAGEGAAAAVKPAFVLRPRAVAPIRTARSAAVQQQPPQPQQQQEPGEQKDAEGETVADGAQGTEALPDATPSKPGLRPRALKKPGVASAPSGAAAALLGATAAAAGPGPQRADAGGEQPNGTGAGAGAGGEPEAGAVEERINMAGAGGAQAVEAQGDSSKRGEAGDGEAKKEGVAAPPGHASSQQPRPRQVAPPAIRRAGGSSLMGALMSGGPRITSTPAAPAAAPVAGGQDLGVGGKEGEDEEERRARERAKRLRTSFALPFMAAGAPSGAGKAAAAAATGPAGFGQQGGKDGGGGGAEGKDEEGQGQGAGQQEREEEPRRRASAKDVRAAMQALQESGDGGEVHIGADGQATDAPERAAGGGSGVRGGRGQGEGGKGAARAAPAVLNVELGEEEDGEEGSDAGGEGAQKEENGQGEGQKQLEQQAGRLKVAGSDLGLDVMEFVPVPLSQVGLGGIARHRWYWCAIGDGQALRCSLRWCLPRQWLQVQCLTMSGAVYRWFRHMSWSLRAFWVLCAQRRAHNPACLPRMPSPLARLLPSRRARACLRSCQAPNVHYLPLLCFLSLCRCSPRAKARARSGRLPRAFVNPRAGPSTRL